MWPYLRGSGRHLACIFPGGRSACPVREGGDTAHHALEVSTSLFLTHNFGYYALADGIKAFLEACETPFWAAKAQARADPRPMLPIELKFLGKPPATRCP